MLGCWSCCRGRNEKMDGSSLAWRVKVVVVGDGQCGKTSLMQRYCRGTLPATYNPTLFDTSIVTATIHGKDIQLVIQDTAGQDDLDRLRPPFYLSTDVVIICFALDNLDSWDNIQRQWVPEVRRYCGKVPIILAGNKVDLTMTTTDHHNSRGASVSSSPSESSSDDEKTGPTEQSSLLTTSTKITKKRPLKTPSCVQKSKHVLKSLLGRPIRGARNYKSTMAEGQSLANRIGAVCYVETSALQNTGTSQVFQAAVQAAVTSKQWRKKYRT